MKKLYQKLKRKVYYAYRFKFGPKALIAAYVNHHLPMNIRVWSSLDGIAITAKTHPSWDCGKYDDMDIAIGMQDAPNPQSGDFSEHVCIVSNTGDGGELDRHDATISGLIEALERLHEFEQPQITVKSA